MLLEEVARLICRFAVSTVPVRTTLAGQQHDVPPDTVMLVDEGLLERATRTGLLRAADSDDAGLPIHCGQPLLATSADLARVHRLAPSQGQHLIVYQLEAGKAPVFSKPIQCEVIRVDGVATAPYVP